jgi:hypothetical protein
LGAEVSTSFTAPAVDVGKYIGAYIDTSNAYDAFDSVSLTATPTPEPASLALLAPLGLLLHRKRRSI